MSSLTLKNIPPKLLRDLRRAASGERRSLSQEAIRLLELVLSTEHNAEAQVAAWRKLAGRWESDLSPEAEAAELMRARTPGRDVDL